MATACGGTGRQAGRQARAGQGNWTSGPNPPRPGSHGVAQLPDTTAASVNSHCIHVRSSVNRIEPIAIAQVILSLREKMHLNSQLLRGRGNGGTRMDAFGLLREREERRVMDTWASS